MTQYLEIYSSHRDRQCDPSPSHFSIPFGKSQSSDPILNGTISYQWNGLGTTERPFSLVNAGYFKTGTTPSAPMLDLHPIYPSTTFIPISSQGNTQPTSRNFYNGYSIINLRTSEVRIIIGYNPSDVSITLNASFLDCLPGDPYYINTNSYQNAIQPPYIDNNGNQLSQIENAYAGYYLVDETLSASLSTIIYQQVSYYSASLRYFYLNNPFSNAGWSPSDNYTLRQSLPIETWNLTQYTYINTDPSYGPRGPVIILPNGSSLQNDFYKGKYIYYSSNANSPASPLLSLSSSTTSTSSTPSHPYYGAFLVTSYRVTYDSQTDTYLREAFVQKDINQTRLPYTLITSGFTFGPGTVPQAPMLSTSDPYYTIDDYYVGCQVTNLSTGEQQLITSQIDGVITLQNTKSINAIGNILAGSTTTLINFFYGNGDGTLLIGSVSPGQIFYHLLSDGTSETSIILTFNLDIMTSIATITLQTPLTFQPSKITVVGDQFQISSTSSGDPYVITTPSNISIVNFLTDNVVPLNYIGTMTSVQTSVCYSISLESLTLPNVTLVTGSQIAFYPYVYVEIKNVSASESASTDIIYSNNPASGRARFIVPITDVINPIDGLFVKLKGDHGQIIKFKPNDNFYFSVTLPNGEYFQPVDSDILSPYLPNSLLQIHAMFSIKRI
jgi:hypothetical protein